MEPISIVRVIVAGFFIGHFLLAARAVYRIAGSDATTGQKAAQSLFAILVPVLGPLTVLAVHSSQPVIGARADDANDSSGGFPNTENSTGFSAGASDSGGDGE